MSSNPLLDEIAKLRAENEDLRAQVAYLKPAPDIEKLFNLRTSLRMPPAQARMLLIIAQRSERMVPFEDLHSDPAVARVQICRIRTKLPADVTINNSRGAGYFMSKDSAARVLAIAGA